MLVNVEQNNSVLGQLESSSVKFYLTGSRYFGNSGPNSDTDFFIDEFENTLTFKGKMFRMGFREVKNHYLDALTVSVYRHDQEKIDVQVCRNAELKLKIQKKFKDIGMKYISTEEWNLAIRLLG